MSKNSYKAEMYIDGNKGSEWGVYGSDRNYILSQALHYAQQYVDEWENKAIIRIEKVKGKSNDRYFV